MPTLGDAERCRIEKRTEARQRMCTPQTFPPPLVTVDAALDGDRMRVTVRGELDIDAGQLLRPALRHALTRAGSGVDLDLRAVEFCDCSGLNILLALRRRALEEGKTLTLAASSPPVQRLLDLTGARSLFLPSRPEDTVIPPASPPDQERSEDSDQDMRALAAQLQRAMQTRPTIDLARGILMATFSLTPETAWKVLVAASQHTNTKLHRLAGEVVGAVHGPALSEPLHKHLLAAVCRTNAAAGSQ